jgi:hypothetical protein
MRPHDRHYSANNPKTGERNREQSRAELIATMQNKFESIGLGYETLRVFGALRCNVHVTCISRDTANDWAQLLGSVFKGASVKVTPTVWDAKKNTGGNLNPTMRKGFLIAVAA